MASRKTYTCFVCQRAGHEVQVFLDGKDEQGRTKYLNEDETKHTHLGSSTVVEQRPQQTQQKETQVSPTVVSESTQLKVIAARLEYAIALLEKLQKQ